MDILLIILVWQSDPETMAIYFAIALRIFINEISLLLMSLTITLWASATHNTVVWCSRIEYNKYSTDDNYSETHPLGILFVIQNILNQ